MQSVLIAVLCLAAAATAADVCQTTCTDVQGNWTGNTSVVIDYGNNTEIIYDVNYKMFVVVNLQYNLAFAVKGRFALVVNIQTGGYILLDIRSGYAVYGKLTITFRNSDGSIDHTKLIIAFNSVFVKYESITSSTSGSFNFILLVTAFYSYQFDLTIIYKGQTELVNHLRASFTVWFKLIMAQIRSGTISVGSGFWGFFVMMFEFDAKIALTIIDIIRVSIQYFQEIQIQFIIRIVYWIRTDIRYLTVFYSMLVDYFTTSTNVTIGGAIAWIQNPSNRPTTVNATFGGVLYTFSVTRLKSEYIIRFSMSSSSGRVVDIRIVYLQGVVLITNEVTSVTVAMYQRSFVVVNATSTYAFVGTSGLLVGVRGKFVAATNLSIYLRARNYQRAAKEVKELIKANSSGGFSFTTLYTAVASGSSSRVDQIVGGGRGSLVLIYYRAFFAQSNGGSYGAIVVGVFGYRSSGLSTFVAGICNTIVTTNQSWSLFIKFFLRISGSGSSSSSSSASSSWTEKGTSWTEKGSSWTEKGSSSVSSWTEVYSSAVTSGKK